MPGAASLPLCPGGEDTELLVRAVKRASDRRRDLPECGDGDRASHQPEICVVILDWDEQPDAGLLLNTARARKASERPLTLAIVGDDAGVPKALQAGANSIVRKPLLVNQVRDQIGISGDLHGFARESNNLAQPLKLAACLLGTQGPIAGIDAGRFELRRFPGADDIARGRVSAIRHAATGSAIHDRVRSREENRAISARGRDRPSAGTGADGGCSRLKKQS